MEKIAIKNINKIGISLIVLVITIIVIIILAAAVILTLTNNNPISEAKKAQFINDLDTFKSELEIYKTQQYATTQGNYEPNVLQADEGTLIYNGTVDSSKNIYDLIKSLKGIKKYEGKFTVVDGQLVYKGKVDDPLGEVAESVGVKFEEPFAPIIVSVPPAKTVLTKGEDVTYTLKITSNVDIITSNIAIDKIKVINSLEQEVNLLPENIIVSALTGNTVSKEFTVTIKTGTLGYDTYKIKVLPESIKNIENQENQEYKTVTGFEISDKEPPVVPTILSTPTTPTNGNVTVTITYSSDTVVSGKLYSLDNGITWLNYTVPITITTNNISVIAKAADEAGNISSNSTTTTIANIDKEGPIITLGTNGGNNETVVSTTINVSDINGLNISSLQYVWDTQNVTTPSTGWIAFTNGANVSKTGDGTYYLWVKANDTFGNNIVTKSNMFKIQVLPSGVTYSGETTGFNYNNPIIPIGFTAMNTSLASWNNLSTDWNKGLVIQDINGNQFVWVPVNASVPYAKWCVNGISYVSAWDAVLPNEVSNEVTQITKYKGFYIGRYEAGNETGTLVIKKNANVWVGINSSDSKIKAESMCVTTKVKSGLLTGTMWDTTLKWIQNSGKTPTNTSSWGNHLTSSSPANVAGYGSLQKSGYSDFWQANNIYDLAGNAWEWTNENYQSTARYVMRGGTYWLTGSADPASYRNYINDSNGTYMRLY